MLQKTSIFFYYMFQLFIKRKKPTTGLLSRSSLDRLGQVRSRLKMKMLSYRYKVI